MKSALITLIILFLSISYTEADLILMVGDEHSFFDPGEEYTINVGDKIWLGIYDNIGEMYDSFIVASNTTIDNIEEGNIFAKWTGNTFVNSPPAVSTSPGWTYLPDNNLWVVDLVDPDTQEIPLPGLGAGVELQAISSGDSYIYLNLLPLYYDDLLILHIIPEPATILILSLGSMVVFRKRKK